MDVGLATAMNAKCGAAGTFIYMAPDRFPTTATDVYALGVTFWAVIGNKRFAATPVKDLAYIIRTTPSSIYPNLIRAIIAIDTKDRPNLYIIYKLIEGKSDLLSAVHEQRPNAEPTKPIRLPLAERHINRFPKISIRARQKPT